MSDRVKNDLLSKCSQGVQKYFNLTSLKEVAIPLPPLEIQKHIVEKIEAESALVESTKKLINIYEAKTKATIAKLWGEDTKQAPIKGELEIEDDLDVGCVGMRIEKGSKEEYIHKILQVAQKGECSEEELLDFLPDRVPHGSETIFTLKGDEVSTELLPELIKGCHLIEKRSATRNGVYDGFGFGSPSITHYLISLLKKASKNMADEMGKWIIDNGGNYYTHRKSNRSLTNG